MTNQIKIDVPADVTRDTLTFVQRILGPVADAADLLSDRIRFYRWKSAVRMLSRAREIAEEQGLAIGEVPLKFLVPFLEKCSLEDEDGSLVETWARLLASAASDYDDRYLKYTDILSKLGHEDVVILSEMKKGAVASEVFSPEHYSAPSWHRITSRMDLAWKSELVEIDPNEIMGPGRLVYIFHEDDIANFNALELRDFPDGLRLQMLQVLGLVFLHSEYMTFRQKRYFGIMAELTPLGFDFVAACQPENDRER
jgi:hypothetical protein